MTVMPFVREEIFERYASARRAARIPAYRVDVLPDVTRHFPVGDTDEAILSFARFDAAAAGRRIDEELANLKARGLAAEWKVHDFDQPADLKTRLEALGLTCHHVEALMVLAVDGIHLRPRDAAGVAIEQASGAALDEIVALQEEVWKCRLPWLGDCLRGMDDPIYCARVDGRVVGSGWIDFHGGSEFAQLCGGSVAEDYRGRGIYSLLFERRLAEAKARGTPFIAVDAAPMSRPILENRGFRFVCHTHPMRTRPFDTSPVTRS
jgi:GNAT superfamily N-acetyltransferase